MRKLEIASLALSAALLAISGNAQTFKLYPGATKMVKESAEMAKVNPPGTEGTIYSTTDSYEKVVAFYRAIGKQYTMPFQKKNVKLPSGQELLSTYFIFDGATDIGSSKSWAKVQRPYVGNIKLNGTTPEYQDVRDITAIVVAQKK